MDHLFYSGGSSTAHPQRRRTSPPDPARVHERAATCPRPVHARIATSSGQPHKPDHYILWFGLDFRQLEAYINGTLQKQGRPLQTPPPPPHPAGRPDPAPPRRAGGGWGPPGAAREEGGRRESQTHQPAATAAAAPPTRTRTRPAPAPPRAPPGPPSRALRAQGPQPSAAGPARRPPLRRDHLGAPDRRHRQRVGQARLRAEGRRGPGLLEPARDQRRRQQVLPRPRRDAGAGDQRQAAHRPRRQHDRRLGGDPALLRDGRGPQGVQGRADPPPRPPEDGASTRRSGSTSASRRSRSAGPASSTRSRTRWPRSWTSPRPRPCSSSSARARAATCPHPGLEQGEDDRRRHRRAARSAS